jgi:hypothetical protein
MLQCMLQYMLQCCNIAIKAVVLTTSGAPLCTMRRCATIRLQCLAVAVWLCICSAHDEVLQHSHARSLQQTCQPGTYRTVGTQGRIICRKCAIGYYSTVINAMSCDRCPTGKCAHAARGTSKQEYADLHSLELLWWWFRKKFTELKLLGVWPSRLHVCRTLWHS